MNQKLLKAFHRTGWSEYRLAKESGISQSTIHRWNNGRTDLSVSNFERIAETIGCRVVVKSGSKVVT